ncbi:hypothetical protein PUMCH_001878 [Australozyma saopauloensis]|uniref:NADPH-dependent diflavin oxidoreductase 1 n=1 Tax=Australozyma saopauloensis TaxID=291208 RepID=A0AAX4H870_9ASCO|nr:hypothetical protein PUMCH_001878 [[Candida] saopauloensis]
MSDTNPPPNSVTILYGSETGNAQDFAHYLGRKLRYYSLRPTVSSLDEYDPRKLVTETRYLIVLCSTTGQGEFPRNLQKFIKFLLRKRLPKDLLNHVKFTTFGLGDSSYPKFNFAIKKIHTRLLQLGCTELSARCESDEMSPEGIDGYFAEWVEKLVPALTGQFPRLFQIDDHTLLPPEYKIDVSPDSADVASGEDLALTRSLNLHRGRVLENHRITAADHFQDVRHIVIESDSVLLYSPGDTLALYPPNDDRSVELLLQLQPHWLAVADKPLKISSDVEVEGGLISQEHMTLRNLIKYHLDVSSIPRRTFFGLLFHFVDDSTDDGKREKEKLYDFSKLEESEDLYDYANRPRRLILETIMEFETNLKIPVEYIVDLIPLIKVRLFLIASKPSPNSVEIAVAIVEYKTMLRRIRRGLCTKWLKQLQPGTPLVFSVHLSNISFGDDLLEKPPVLMIAPGTGIAPMKSLIEKEAGNRSLVLFQGFRETQKDYLFQSVWEPLVQLSTLQVYNAVSREAGAKHKYVQDRLFAEKDLVRSLIVDEKAIVFVCGSSGNMPRQVRITLVEILRGSVTDPEQYLLDMENGGRYIQETW